MPTVLRLGLGTKQFTLMLNNLQVTQIVDIAFVVMLYFSHNFHLFFSDGSTVDIVFNVVEIPAGQGRKFSRAGLCTGWLQQLTAGVANGEFPKVRNNFYF